MAYKDPVFLQKGWFLAVDAIGTANITPAGTY